MEELSHLLVDSSVELFKFVFKLLFKFFTQFTFGLLCRLVYLSGQLFKSVVKGHRFALMNHIFSDLVKLDEVVLCQFFDMPH